MGEGASKMEVRVSEDRMSAELEINPEMLPSLDEVRALLTKEGIVYGVSLERVEEAVAHAGTWIKIADGLPPTKTIHGSLFYHFKIPGRAEIMANDEDKVDYKKLGLIVNVKSGDLLATLVDPIPGAPGRTVLGRELLVEEPKSAKLKAGKNVNSDAEGRNLFSTINGRIIVDSSGSLSVEPDLIVFGDVGPATGNIDFIGPIVINGNVCTDYKVKSADRITVQGHVEGGVIDAVNGITVAGGVFGVNKAILQTRGNIDVRHAQDAALLCGDTLQVKDSLLRVRAIAANAILIENGSIVGGTATAPTIVAQTVGGEAGTKTVIEIGISPRVKLNADRLETEFRHHRAELLHKRQRLDPLLAMDKAGKIMQREEKEELEALENDCAELERLIINIAAELKMLFNNPQCCVKGNITVSGEIHPGTIFSSVHSEYPIGILRKGMTGDAVEGKINLS